MRIIDTNRNTKASLPGLAEAGIKTIGRYYSAPGAGSKILSKDEADAICAAGMSVFTVFEAGAEPSLDAETGSKHAGYAKDQAHAVGQPKGSAIYFALDSNLVAADVADAKAYFDGVTSVIGGEFEIGVYSDGTICKAMLDANICKFAWLSASRGYDGSKVFYASEAWSLAQDPKINQPLAGIRVDYNESNGVFGAFVVGEAVVAAAAVAPAAAAAAQAVAPPAIVAPAAAPAAQAVAPAAVIAAPAVGAAHNFYTDVISNDPRFHSAERISDPNLLEPATRAQVQAIIDDATHLGIDLIIFETFRSRERQSALFDQGVTQLKQVGVHHYGLACDLVKRVSGEPSWKGDYSFLGHLARQHGLVWGGDWGQPQVSHSFQDNDHVQRCTVGRQPSLFSGAWYPDDAYDPYKDGAK
jgi:Domain of unknown function (DUF1906)/D-alanyl-D-alanine carboxypeptidase